MAHSCDWLVLFHHPQPCVPIGCDVGGIATPLRSEPLRRCREAD